MANKRITKVAVLGAGVMGSQIAAHFVNAKIPTILFDLPFDGPNKNQIVQNAIAHLAKLKPAPIVLPKMAEHIQVGNYADDLAKLSDCDFIIEAIAENETLKTELFKKVTPFIAKHAIFATNSSGLSINRLALNFPAEIRKRFLGVHFFNPPRYMQLVELIPNDATDSAVLDFVETVLVSELGKGVVRAKDTPNFIANRVGVFALLATLKHQAEYQLDYATVDALTGTLIGRPKSATFRTLDVVGLDTMANVVATMHKECQNDPWHAYFTLPADYQALLEQKFLGQKSKRGFYQKQGQTILVYDPKSNQYTKSHAEVSPEIQTLLQKGFKPSVLLQLAQSSDPQAQFLWAVFRDLLQYCAYHADAIAHQKKDIDRAMQLGFGWQHGPFEIWQQAGVAELIAQMQKEGSWQLKDSVSAALTKEDTLQKTPLPIYAKQHAAWQKTLYENKDVLVRLSDENTAVLQLTNRNPVITEAVIEGINHAIECAENEANALVIWHESSEKFCFGANLKLFAQFQQEKNMAAIDNIVAEFQQTMQRLRYSAIPVIAAVRGFALGGGCEMLLHCDHIVAAFESYIGLVEMGVGLIPAGGGLLHAAKLAAKVAGDKAPFNELQTYFSHIAQGKVSSSAHEAIAFGYLPEDTTLIANTHEVLYHALQKARQLASTSYRPCLPSRFKAGGRDAAATLHMQLLNWREGQFISEDDFTTAKALANVLCGGDVDSGTWVDEAWFYQIERKAFVELAQRDYTQKCIQARLHLS